MPPVEAGMPSIARNQSRTTSSTWAQADASSQTPAKKLWPAQSQSPRTAASVGAPGTNARKRGWLMWQA